MGQSYSFRGVSPATGCWKFEFRERGGRGSPRGRHPARYRSARSHLSSRWQAPRSKGGRTMLRKGRQVKLGTGPGRMCTAGVRGGFLALEEGTPAS